MKKMSIILGIALLFLNGCWSAKELNEIAVATGIGIDKAKDGKLEVTVQLLNPAEIAGKGKTSASPATTYRTVESTFFEAIRKLTKETPRKIYMSHIRVVVISEEFAKDGIHKILDFLSRDHEFRTNFLFLIAKDHKASDILNVITPLENIPANKLYSSLEMSEKAWAPTTSVSLDELISDLISDGKSAVISGVIIEGNEEVGDEIQNIQNISGPATLQISNLAVFKNDQLVGWFNSKESKGLNYIRDQVTNTVGRVPCPAAEGKVVVEVTNNTTELKGNVVSNNPTIKIDQSAEVNIGELVCDVDLSDPKLIEQIEKNVEKEIKDIMQSAITRAKEEFETDVFGFGEVIHRSNPKYWKKNKGEWDQIFTKMDVEINTDVKVRRTGTIIQSFPKEEN